MRLGNGAVSDRIADIDSSGAVDGGDDTYPTVIRIGVVCV